MTVSVERQTQKEARDKSIPKREKKSQEDQQKFSVKTANIPPIRSKEEPETKKRSK
jgi:hypothetical protein